MPLPLNGLTIYFNKYPLPCCCFFVILIVLLFLPRLLVWLGAGTRFGRFVHMAEEESEKLARLAAAADAYETSTLSYICCIARPVRIDSEYADSTNLNATASQGVSSWH